MVDGPRCRRVGTGPSAGAACSRLPARPRVSVARLSAPLTAGPASARPAELARVQSRMGRVGPARVLWSGGGRVQGAGAGGAPSMDEDSWPSMGEAVTCGM
jgi:hypothetical protein